MPNKRTTRSKRPLKSDDDEQQTGDEPQLKRTRGRGHLTVKDDDDTKTKAKTNSKTDKKADTKSKPETKKEGTKKKTESEVSDWLPDNWPEAYDNIKKMMDGVKAPLEDMPWYAELDPKTTKPSERFKILVALMMSSQTKDETTLKVWNKICQDGLSIDWVLEKSESELSEAIKSVNFRNTKAQNIRKVAAICKDKYKGDTPDNAKELIDLPGVGPKMAYLFLQSCYKKSEGLGVDVHMHRLASRLGWVKKKPKDAEATRVELESWLVKDLMFEFNRLIPRFGQMKCTAKNPSCNDCLNRDICPGAEK